MSKFISAGFKLCAMSVVLFCAMVAIFGVPPKRISEWTCRNYTNANNISLASHFSYRLSIQRQVEKDNPGFIFLGSEQACVQQQCQIDASKTALSGIINQCMKNNLVRAPQYEAKPSSGGPSFYSLSREKRKDIHSLYCATNSWSSGC